MRRTFELAGEDYTVGNLLKAHLAQNPAVTFVGQQKTPEGISLVIDAEDPPLCLAGAVDACICQMASLRDAFKAAALEQ